MGDKCCGCDLRKDCEGSEEKDICPECGCNPCECEDKEKEDK